jgi:hypothetical protein
MKNVILTLLAAMIFLTAKAQIVTEAVYPGGASNTYGYLHPIKLTNGGDKYCEFFAGQSQIIVYNLNHTIFRTINLPALPLNATYVNVHYVSDALFDQNSSDIEYILQYTTTTSSWNHVFVYRENGTMLFHRDTVGFDPIYSSETPARIFRTTAGTKWILSSQINGSAIVIGLPGNLPCTECSVGPLMVQSNEDQISTGSPYPNPASESTTIPYALPEGERTGWLVLFDLAGQEVKRWQITNTFTSVTLNTTDIAAGTYSYRVEAGQTVLQGEKLIIIH